MTKTILTVHAVTVAHATDAAEAAGQSVSPGAIVYIVICVSLMLTIIMAILRPFVPLIATALSAVASLLGAAGRWLSTLVRSPLCALLQLAQFLLTLGGFALVGTRHEPAARGRRVHVRRDGVVRGIRRTGVFRTLRAAADGRGHAF